MPETTKATLPRDQSLVQGGAIQLTRGKAHFLGRKRQAQSNSLLTRAALAATTKQSPIMTVYPSFSFIPKEFRLGVLKPRRGEVGRFRSRNTCGSMYSDGSSPPAGHCMPGVPRSRGPKMKSPHRKVSVILFILFMPQSIKKVTTRKLQTLFESPDLL